jgi:hypothetical protein
MRQARWHFHPIDCSHVQAAHHGGEMTVTDQAYAILMAMEIKLQLHRQIRSRSLVNHPLVGWLNSGHV